MSKPDYIGFARSFHHHGEESDYCFAEIATRMQQYGIVMDSIFGYHVQAHLKIMRGVKIETPKGLVKMVFKKELKTGGYHLIFKKIKDYRQIAQK